MVSAHCDLGDGAYWILESVEAMLSDFVVLDTGWINGPATVDT
jgi:hypothetical protein